MTAPATLDPDPFATPEDTRQAKRDSIITGGRYRLPKRDGSPKPGGYMRTSNLVSAFSDQKRLQDWTVTTVLAGLVVDPALYGALVAFVNGLEEVTPAAIKAAREELLELAERAKNAAGGGRGAERGNRIHAIVEAEWRGMPYAASGEERELIRLVAKALAEAQLRPVPGMQERIVMVEALDACGTLDTILMDLVTDLFHIGDTKSQKKFWTYQEVEAQLAFYAHGDAMWCPETCAWVPMPYVLDRTRGAAIWVPPVEESPTGEPHAQVVPLDLVRGWETVQIAKRNVEQRAACKSVRQVVSGVRMTWEQVRPPSTVERYARLLESVETHEDGSRVVAEARAAGAWGPELEQVAARKAVQLSAL